MVYHFTQPMLKQSLKAYEVFNSEQLAVGSIQRFYQKRIQRLLDFFVDGFFLHIKVHDEKDKVKVKAVQAMTLIKDSWSIYEDDQVHVLKDKTKIKTNPKYLFYYKGKEYLIFKDYLDKFIRGPVGVCLLSRLSYHSFTNYSENTIL